MYWICHNCEDNNSDGVLMYWICHNCEDNNSDGVLMYWICHNCEDNNSDGVLMYWICHNCEDKSFRRRIQVLDLSEYTTVKTIIQIQVGILEEKRYQL